MLGLDGLIERVASGQQVDVLPTMALVGGDELQAAMAVFGVVPARELLRPETCLLQVLEGLVGGVWVALEGTE